PADEPAGRLSDHPPRVEPERPARRDEARVAVRGPGQEPVLLEQRDMPAAPGEEIGAGDARRAAADHDHVLGNIRRVRVVHRTMRLYHVPRTRSTRVLWLLEELGAP